MLVTELRHFPEKNRVTRPFLTRRKAVKNTPAAEYTEFLFRKAQVVLRPLRLITPLDRKTSLLLRLIWLARAARQGR